ncbi:MAG: type II toxin-antitoxin system PemK/MazF family toxin [Cyanobacteria bacterium P01_A01_bin.116]
MYRGEIWWADLPAPAGSGPGYYRPVLIIQADSSSRTNIQTVIVAVITSNTRLAELPGNVLLAKDKTGLSKTSVVNVSQLLTIDKTFLVERVGFVSESLQEQIDDGLRMILYL